MTDEMAKISSQFLVVPVAVVTVVAANTRPTTKGPAMPPKLPIMFMLPETVPAYLPPMSMQVAQLPGIVRSLQKLAMPIESIASNGSLM